MPPTASAAAPAIAGRACNTCRATVLIEGENAFPEGYLVGDNVNSESYRIYRRPRPMGSRVKG